MRMCEYVCVNTYVCKHNTYTNSRRRERRAIDPIYREKMITTKRIDRLKKKTRKEAEDGGHVGHVADVDAIDVRVSNVLIEVIQDNAAEDSELADGLKNDAESKDVVSSAGDHDHIGYAAVI